MAITIPSAAGLERPTPRGVNTVQRYRVAEPIPATFPRTEAAELYSGAAAARAGETVAATFFGLSHEIDRWTAQLDQTKAQDALNQLRMRRQELTSGDNGFLKVQGGDVLSPPEGPGTSIFETYPKQYEDYAHELYDKLPSGPARTMFRHAAESEITNFKDLLGRYGIAQAEKFQGIVDETTKTQLDDRALLSPLDEFATSLDAIRQSETSRLARHGVTGNPADVLAGQRVSRIVRMRIEGALATGDTATATALYSAYSGSLSGPDRISVDGQMKTLGVNQKAGQQADEFMPYTPAPQSSTAPLMDRAKGAIAGIETRGWTNPYSAIGPVADDKGNRAWGKYQVMTYNVAPWTREIVGRAMTPQQFIADTPEAHAAQEKVFEAKFSQYVRETGSMAGAAARWFGSGTDVLGTTTASYVRQFTEGMGLPATGPAAARTLVASTDTGYVPMPPTNIVVPPDTAAFTEVPNDNWFRIDWQQFGPPPPPAPREQQIGLDLDFTRAMGRNNEVNAGNDVQRRATALELQRRYELRRLEIDTQQRQINVDYDEYLKTRPTVRPPPALWNRLSFEQQATLDKVIGLNLAGPKVQTSERIYDTIWSNLNHPDYTTRARWAGVDLWPFKPYLDDADFRKLRERQVEIATKGPEESKELLDERAMIDAKLKEVGALPIKPGDLNKDQIARANRVYREYASAIDMQLEENGGKPVTREQRRAIVDRLVYDVYVGESAWNWLKLEARATYKPFYDLTIDDVPAADRRLIIDDLRRSGHPTSDEWVLWVYASAHRKGAEHDRPAR